MRYVIEIGERRKADTGEFEWFGHGFYNLFEPNGGPMIVVERIDDAYHFDKRDHAETMIAGYYNLAGMSRVVEHGE